MRLRPYECNNSSFPCKMKASSRQFMNIVYWTCTRVSIGGMNSTKIERVEFFSFFTRDDPFCGVLSIRLQYIHEAFI
jgi:hypothetical protein